jgi:uncharacterized protein YjbJ (UPF0337 family)
MNAITQMGSEGQRRLINRMRHDADTEQLIPSIFFLLKKWESITWNREGAVMNWDQLEGKWKQYKGEVREKWGKLTDDDLHIIAGKRDQLIGRLQERYGIAKEVAAREADEFVRNLTKEEAAEPRGGRAKAVRQG